MKPVKVILPATGADGGGPNASRGGQGDCGTTSFFEPWVVVLTGDEGSRLDKTYPNTPLSEFKTTDAYVLTHGLDALVDDEEEEKDEEV